MHVGHVGLRAETHGGWFVFADHQSGLPEHVIFKEQVRSTTMLPAIERVGGKTSNGDQQGGRGEPDAALSHERHGEPIGATPFATSRSATVVTVRAYHKRSEGGTGESRGAAARQWWDARCCLVVTASP